ncbi:GNAT family N-acetyltransferase [Maricaulis sp. D1M11]|uniref:GNAT family N-acetyltransferase n=1 Tax=Maricaulis sp. D1M11 TaxID=3076117 RepID=UPI0039B5AC8D
MSITIKRFDELSAADKEQWNQWAAPSGQLISPYLRAEFAGTIARYRDDVRIAVLEQDGTTNGYFAHHTPQNGVLRPVGAPMSDYQGAVIRPGARAHPTDFLKATGSSAIVYDNWFCPLGGVKSARRERDGSVVVDLSAGADAYFSAQRSQFKDHFKKTARRLRAAERDFGPARVEIGDPCGSAFDQLVAWKRQQYRDTAKLDVMGIDWVMNVLDHLQQSSENGFGGLTAALWFGDRLAAVEFGIQADGVYHSWFPAYDPELAKYSPGLLLMHGIFEQAQDMGLNRVDLGRGGQHYKKYYASYEVPLDQGRVLTSGFAALAIYGWEAAEKAAQVMPERVADIPARLRRRWAQVSAYERRLGPRLASMALAMRQPQAA